MTNDHNADECKRFAGELVERFPEINFSNYGQDEVEALQAWGFEAVDALRAIAAQPALTRPEECKRFAGEREAFQRALHDKAPFKLTADRIAAAEWAWQAGAAWQRTQSAGVPEGWRELLEDMVKELRSAYFLSARGEAFAQRIDAMLAAAPAQPAAQDQGEQQEDLHVWRATSRLGYTCHFGEASAARAWAGENGTIERVDLTPVPDLQVVERQDQGEVHRLREALDAAEVAITASDSALRHLLHNIRSSKKRVDLGLAPSSADEALRRIGQYKRALAASTGQEVKP